MRCLLPFYVAGEKITDLSTALMIQHANDTRRKSTLLNASNFGATVRRRNKLTPETLYTPEKVVAPEVEIRLSLYFSHQLAHPTNSVQNGNKYFLSH